jgi:hypothetical protein
MDKKITVQKLGSEPKQEKVTKEIGGRVKPMPKSILKKTSKLKLKGLRDPAKASRRHSVKLLTSKGHRRHDKTMKKKIGKLSDRKVQELTMGSGLVKNPEMPQHLQRQILDHAVSAGFVSL